VQAAAAVHLCIVEQQILAEDQDPAPGDRHHFAAVTGQLMHAPDGGVALLA
jgi:hypothetical protein